MASVSALGYAASGQPVIAVPLVDLDRFAGVWYEIARLPSKREKNCLADVVELVALADKPDRLQLVHTCKAKKDYTDVSNASLKAERGSGGGKLKVTYLWPFHERDWILDLGANYDWVLIGSPDHKILMAFSRTPTLDPEVLSEMRQKAAVEGYATDQIKMVLQTQR